MLAAGAALCAAGLALAVAFAAPAQAQSNSSTEVWSGTMTVGTSSGGDLEGYGEGAFGSLSDPTFTFKGVNHTIVNLVELGERIGFAIVPGFGSVQTDAAVSTYIEDLSLRIVQGGTTYRLDFATRDLPSRRTANLNFEWSDTTRSWSDGDSISVQLLTRAPSAPRMFRAEADAENVSLTWNAPATNGGGNAAQRGIHRYEARYKVGNGSYGAWTTVPGGGSARSGRFTGLEVGVEHTFQLRARNDYGANMYSSEVSATPRRKAVIESIDIVTDPTGIGSFPGFHRTLDFITVEVKFNRDVIGTPFGGIASLKLLVGDKERTAQALFTNSLISKLKFTYQIQGDDVDSDGIAVPANALTLPAGGTLKDSDDADAELTHEAFEFADHPVNPPPPEITNIEVVSEVPDRGFYLHTAGDTMEFRVTFSEPVTLSGDDDDLVLSVRFGSGSFQVLYAGGSGTRELSFATPLAAQFTDTDGVSVPAGSLTLIGATTLKGPYGQDAVLTHGGYEFPGHLVNALPDPPQITSMRLATDVPARGYFETGDIVLFEVAFTAPVIAGGGGGAVYLKLLVGETEVFATDAAAQLTATPEFLYQVEAGHEDGDGVSVPAGMLTVDANATFKDEYGQDAVLTHGAFGPFAGSLVNAPPPPPYITGIDIGSDLPDRGYYETGDNIDVRVTFSRAVTSSGSTGFVFLKLLVGGTEREVNLYDVRQKTLTFSYTVQADDEDHDGVQVPANALTLTGTQTLKDRDDQDAVLTHGAFGPFAQSLVNTPPPPPYITGIDIGSDLPDRGYYETGENIDVQVTFSRPVTSSGSTGFVFLKLLVGGTEREVNLYDVRQKTLTFTYAVQAGDEDHDGVQVPADAVTLTGTQTLKGPLRPGRGGDPRRLRSLPVQPGELTGGPAGPAAEPCGDGGDRERGAVPLGPAGR